MNFFYTLESSMRVQIAIIVEKNKQFKFFERKTFFFFIFCENFFSFKQKKEKTFFKKKFLDKIARNDICRWSDELSVSSNQYRIIKFNQTKLFFFSFLSHAEKKLFQAFCHANLTDETVIN